jgi:hypothetical protein
MRKLNTAEHSSMLQQPSACCLKHSKESALLYAQVLRGALKYRARHRMAARAPHALIAAARHANNLQKQHVQRWTLTMSSFDQIETHAAIQCCMGVQE